MKLGLNKKVKIIGCSTGKSPDKGTPFFALEFQNQEGEVIEGTFFLSDKKQNGDSNEENVKKTLQTLLNAGYKRKSLADMSDPKLKMEDLFDEPSDELNITIEEKAKTDGTSYASVKYFNVGYGNGLSKADHAESKMIFKNTKFDGFLSQLKKGEKPKYEKKNESMQSDTPDINSDDVPF